MKPIRTETKQLPVKLTNNELRDLGDQLALVTQQIGNEEEDQKQIKDTMKAKMSELSSRQSRLALTISRREEYRDVEVEFVFADDGNTVNEFRQDTGELISARPVRDSERQAKLEPRLKDG